MPTVHIDEAGCRDCSLCIDVCPTEVFARNDERKLAWVARPDDCIGCSSCEYICPSRCLEVTDRVEQRPFQRIEENAALVERFLQKAPVSKALSDADYDSALQDVRVRLFALGEAVTQTMGRGQKAVGRAAGALCAAHLPEMYEETSLSTLLTRMNRRFHGSFSFEVLSQASDTELELRFPHCAIRKVVESHGSSAGQAVLCGMFHEYWAGLVGTFLNKNFAVDLVSVDGDCRLKLRVRG